MRVSLPRRDLHPLAALSLTLTGLAALVGGLIVVGVGVAEWLDPPSPFRGFPIGYDPRPFELLPPAMIPCLVGTIGLLLTGARLVGGTGVVGLFVASVGTAMIATTVLSPVPGALGLVIVPLGLVLFGRWVTLSGR